MLQKHQYWEVNSYNIEEFTIDTGCDNATVKHNHYHSIPVEVIIYKYCTLISTILILIVYVFQRSNFVGYSLDIFNEKNERINILAMIVIAINDIMPIDSVNIIKKLYNTEIIISILK